MSWQDLPNSTGRWIYSSEKLGRPKTTDVFEYKGELWAEAGPHEWKVVDFPKDTQWFKLPDLEAE